MQLSLVISIEKSLCSVTCSTLHHLCRWIDYPVSNKFQIIWKSFAFKPLTLKIFISDWVTLPCPVLWIRRMSLLKAVFGSQAFDSLIHVRVIESDTWLAKMLERLFVHHCILILVSVTFFFKKISRFKFDGTMTQ